MTKPYLSVIIPTHNRPGLLLWHLREIAKQTLVADQFEVIVVEDGGEETPFVDYRSYNLRFFRQDNAGPATARNLGARHAEGKFLLFVGDDCIPTPHLFFRHWLRHKQAKEPCVIQGFTDWHPQIPPDTFMNWLNQGLQANWLALKKSDGSWIPGTQNIPGWFLTTNVSLPKELFDFLGGFNQSFPHAAWEDIELSTRLQGHGQKTFFEPDAVNLHHHKQTLDGFVRRQITEGKSRLHLCAAQPMMGPQLLDPKGLRETSADMLAQAIQIAKILHYDDNPDVQEIRQRRWHTALRYASLEGIRQGLKERAKTSPIWRAIIHLHNNDAIMQVCAAAAAYEKGDYDYSHTCAEWADRGETGSWPLACVHGEIYLKMGRIEDAVSEFRRSLDIGPGNDWAIERLAGFPSK